MTDLTRLLAAYDDQLRTDAATPSAISIAGHGPLRLVRFAAGRGYISYRDLDGLDEPAIRELVQHALHHFRADPTISQVVWKTRAHDHAPGLHASLLAAGFTPGQPESIMLGEAAALAVEVRLPEGVTLRTVTDEKDVRAMSAMTDEAFDEPVSDDIADAHLRRLSRRDGMELWVAEAQGQMVCAGRLEPVRGTDFAGIWGGATLGRWRSQGIYRALTAARARSALSLGKKLIHSDSTEDSRPILERSGLVKVSTTTPYHWRR